MNIYISAHVYIYIVDRYCYKTDNTLQNYKTDNTLQKSPTKETYIVDRYCCSAMSESVYILYVRF